MAKHAPFGRLARGGLPVGDGGGLLGWFLDRRRRYAREWWRDGSWRHNGEWRSDGERWGDRERRWDREWRRDGGRR